MKNTVSSIIEQLQASIEADYAEARMERDALYTKKSAEKHKVTVDSLPVTEEEGKTVNLFADEETLLSHTAKELKEACKRAGITGYSRMTKAMMVSAILEHQKAVLSEKFKKEADAKAVLDTEANAFAKERANRDLEYTKATADKHEATVVVEADEVTINVDKHVIGEALMTKEELRSYSGKELREACKRLGIKFSKLNKEELVDAIHAKQTAKTEAKFKAKAELREARDMAKLELENDYNRALSFYRQARNISEMTASDYADMTEMWKTFSGLVGNEDLSNITDESSLKDIAEKLAGFAGGDISALDTNGLRNYINSVLEDFVTQVSTETIHKDTMSIIKMSIKDLNFNIPGCLPCFHSKDAQKFNGEVTYVDEERFSNIVKVGSAEDGISRILEAKGLSSITINMEMPMSVPEDEQKRLKKLVFEHGVYDVSTKKKYLFCYQSPSSNRKANITMVEANNWKEISDLWLEFTGFKTMDELKAGFCNDKGETVLSKFIARISTRGSNSFSMEKIAPDIDAILRKANVLYTDDASVTVHRDYKTITAPGVLEMKSGDRKLTPGDGEMIGSIEFMALVAVGLKRISRNEYSEFKVLFSSVGRDMSKVKNGGKLYRILKKIPMVVQIRHEAKKGIIVGYNLEAIESLENVHLICPESARKFVAGEWSEYSLEVCNFLKKKGDYVFLNPQFINALRWENPEALLPIAKYWCDYAERSLDSIAERLNFAHLSVGNDEEEEYDGSPSKRVRYAIKANSDLINEVQICNWSKDQYKKFFNDMSIGRMMVPGTYSYMVMDPGYMINNILGLDVPTLKAGEYRYNGKTCKVGLFRSPLIHPTEAQYVQCTKADHMWYLNDVIVMNGFDGIWDNMGGGDFDGDTCAIIPDDNEFGKIVCDGIRDIKFDIWEPAQVAKKVGLTYKNLINYLVETAKRDRTGVITNYAIRALCLSEHFYSCVYYAKKYGCDDIYLIHPEKFNRPEAGLLGINYKPQIANIDGKRSFCVKAPITVKQMKDSITGEYKHVFSDGPVGHKTFEEISELAEEYFMELVTYLRLLQGREIDGAKTGIYAEGESGEDFVDDVKVVITPHCMLNRQIILGRRNDTRMDNNKLNMYHCISPWGLLNDYVQSRASIIMDKLENGSDKIYLLQSLLDKDEAEQLNRKYDLTASIGRVGSILDVVQIRKDRYNHGLSNIMKAKFDDEQKRIEVETLKEAEINELYNWARYLQISPEVVAAACYIVTYNKASKTSSGLAYGWILFSELLSVFSRGNKRYQLFRMPQNVEKASIYDGILYVNGDAYRKVDAPNMANVAIEVINGRSYALVHKNVTKIAEARYMDAEVGRQHSIGVIGFKYHIAGYDDPMIRWKELVKANNFEFDIILDDTGRLVSAINGKSISAIMRGADYSLVNRRVRIVGYPNRPYDKASGNGETANHGAIYGIIVQVVGDAVR